MAIRNVLFVIADQWRGDTMGAVGHPSVRTPNLDAIARDGVLFRRHYVQASPCGPARASLLTGQYLSNHRQVSNSAPLDGRLPNLAIAARQAGYDPVLFGYTDTPIDPRPPASSAEVEPIDWIAPGFRPIATFLGSDGLAGWRGWLAERGYAVPADVMGTFLPAGGFDPSDPTAPCLYKSDHSDTSYLADAAIDYLAAERERPWFLHFCCLRPHPPMVAPEPYNRMYAAEDLPAPRRPSSHAAIRRQHPFIAWSLDRQNLTEYFRRPLALEEIGELDDHYMRAAYYGNCTEVDANIGRLIDALKSTGAYDQTLIVFTSDHGEQLGENWLYGRRGYFDGHFHVPLIIRDPRPEANSTRGDIVDSFTESIDLMPTILEALGIDPPSTCDGHSLLPFFRGEPPPNWRKAAHWELDFRDVPNHRTERALGIASDECNLAVIRDEHYKYVHFAALPPVFFDLDKDPGETTNLAADPAYARLVMKYAQEMLSWRMSHLNRGLTDYWRRYGSTETARRYPVSPSHR